METIKQEEIPIIEENYTPPAPDETGNTKPATFEDGATDEIDVRDIPF